MNDLTPNDLSHMSDEDFNALCPQGHHAPGAEPLSPAAQAVLDAVDALYEEDIPEDRCIIAAALRAAADQVVPEEAEAVGDQHDEARQDQWLRIRWKLLAIAAELEGQ